MPSPVKALPRRLVKIVDAAVSELFRRARRRWLRPDPRDKELVFSLPAVYAASASVSGVDPNPKHVRELVESASSYLEVAETKAKTETRRRLQGLLHQKQAGADVDVKAAMVGEMSKLWGKVGADVKRLVDTETQRARALGSLEGIVAVAEHHGVDDPTVVFMVVRDEHLCLECKRLHLLEDGITPRAWKLSQVQHSYHVKGENKPSVSGLHPSCRCSCVYVAEGYGFKNGALAYIKPGYDLYENQNS